MQDANKLNMAAIAAALAIIGEQFTVIEGAFRSAAGGGKDSGVDGKAAKPVRGRKPAAKSDDGGGDEVTEDTVREALKELSATKGKEAMVAVLAKFGAGRLSDVDESSYGELAEAIKEAMEEEEEEAPAKPAKGKAAATKGKKVKEPEVDVDELTEKFKELVDADKAKAKAVLKKAGLAKLSDLDTDDASAVKELFDAITEALDDEGEDDLM